MTAARFLVVLDADSTLIRNEVIELLADEAGRRAEVQAATEAAMRGEVDFATSLRSRVDALRGVPTAAFERVRARIEPTPGVHELTAAVHERGGVVGVVSGGFHEILDPLAERLGGEYRIITYDQPGHGLTGAHPRDDYSAAGMFEALLPSVGPLVVTCASSSRAAAPDELAAIARRVSPATQVLVAETPGDALNTAWRMAPRIVVAGSIFLLGDVLKLIETT